MAAHLHSPVVYEVRRTRPKFVSLEVMLSADDYDAAQAERYGRTNRALPVATFRESSDRSPIGLPGSGRRPSDPESGSIPSHSRTATISVAIRISSSSA